MNLNKNKPENAELDITTWKNDDDSLENDLKFRDFTCYGLYIDPCNYDYTDNTVIDFRGDFKQDVKN